MALYNAHWLVYKGGPDLSVVSNTVIGDRQYFVGDITQVSPRSVQRVCVQLAFAQLLFVWGWFYAEKGRAWAVAFALWFMLQGAQVIWTGNLQTKEWQDWIILAVLMAGAFLWNRLEPHKYLRVVWNRWTQQ